MKWLRPMFRKRAQHLSLTSRRLGGRSLFQAAKKSVTSACASPLKSSSARRGAGGAGRGAGRASFENLKRVTVVGKTRHARASEHRHFQRCSIHASYPHCSGHWEVSGVLTYKLNLTPRLGGSKSDGNAVSTFCKTQFAHWAISGAPRPSFEFERLSRSPSQCSGSGSRARARALGLGPEPELCTACRERLPAEHEEFKLAEGLCSRMPLSRIESDLCSPRPWPSCTRWK